jgi:IMP dehydrogenase
VAAKKMGITALDAYIIDISQDIELGMERTAQAMNLRSLDDIQVLGYASHPLVALTHRLAKKGG